VRKSNSIWVTQMDKGLVTLVATVGSLLGSLDTSGFGVFIDSKLLVNMLSVFFLLGVCNQRLYLLSQLRKQGLSDECVAVVYDAIVSSKELQHALSAWGG